MTLREGNTRAALANCCNYATLADFFLLLLFIVATKLMKAKGHSEAIPALLRLEMSKEDPALGS